MFENKEEAIEFLSKHLDIDNVLKRLEKDNVRLLDDIAKALQHKLPFNNLRLIGGECEKKRPSLTEIKSDVYSGIGGLCYTLNLTAYYLTKALDYDAYVCCGHVFSSAAYFNSHDVVLIQMNKVGPPSYNLIEAGLGYPTFRSVNLDFKESSSEFTDSFHTYKYAKDANGLIMRLHKMTPETLAKKPRSHELYFGKWKRHTQFDIKNITNDIASLNSYFDLVYSDPNATSFLTKLIVFGFPDGKAKILINDESKVEKTENDKLEIRKKLSNGECFTWIKESYPQMPSSLIQKALRNWSKVYQL